MGVKRNPVPGRSWRILAHYDRVPLPSEDIHSREYEKAHLRMMRQLVKGTPSLKATYPEQDKRTRALTEQCTFDELVIDDWLHLEQMSDRAYWMRLGDAWIWIDIPATVAPVITIERGAYE